MIIEKDLTKKREKKIQHYKQKKSLVEALSQENENEESIDETSDQPESLVDATTVNSNEKKRKNRRFIPKEEKHQFCL